MRYTQRLVEAFNSLFKAELVRNRGPWRSIDDLEISYRNRTKYMAAACSRPAASGINYAVDCGESVWRAGLRQQALGISPMWLPSSSRMTFVRVAESQRTTNMPRRL
ncbi:hypothetical protein ACT17Q_15745 [Cellulomonas sp. CW35]|uniref:hypothetical protein n=1 Tax=Cellulomonas sp. CW35 TaxID=3458249 RepID=UPI0040340AE1